MRDTIKNRIMLSENEKRALWNSAIFVFDTNVLLALYKYSKKTAESLIRAIVSRSPRIWIPKQVALEFANNRYTVIYNNGRKFDDNSKIAKAKREFLEIFRNEIIDKDCVGQIEEIIDSWLVGLKDESAYVTNPQDDYILENLCRVFEGKVGEGFSNDRDRGNNKRGKQKSR